MSNDSAAKSLLAAHCSMLVFIVGPTASGKSDLAMQVAKANNGEIICADSQTIRRSMDIGTAKPSHKDRLEIPHHMLDIIDPYDTFSVAEFKLLAEQVIVDIQSRGKLPIIVGGTGLYIDSLLFNFEFRSLNTSQYSREQLNEMTVADLQTIITKNGYTLPHNAENPRHLIRTIESGATSMQGGSLYSKPMREGAIVVGLDPGRGILNQRIEQRVDVMLQEGLVDEYHRILDTYGEPPREFDAIAYKTIHQNPGMNQQELHEKLFIADRQYAKKQRTWLKRNTHIQWFAVNDEAVKYLYLSFK